jgi:dCTP deaminase
MMILPAQHIRKFAIDYLMITPFSERTVFNGKTFGLGPATYDCRCRQRVILGPGEFELASTIERVNLPYDIRATVCDKSSWARLGLSVQNTKIDPGFRGHVTLELNNNHHKNLLIIEEGDPIMQLEFAYLSESTELPYNGKYQDQGDKVVESIWEKGPYHTKL